MINPSIDSILQQADRLSPTELINLIQALLDRLKSTTQISLNQNSEESSPEKSTGWSSFIGYFEAAPDLSVNYKEYLLEGMNHKYDNH